MTYSVVVEPEAQNDLLNIYTYISLNDSSKKAEKFILELKQKILSLETMPYRCRESHYVEDKDTRDLIHKKYTIVFKIINKSLHVLTIFRQKSY